MYGYKRFPNYLEEYTQILAESFINFKPMTSMKKIQYDLWDSNFEEIFKSIFKIVESPYVTTTYYKQTPKTKEMYREDIRIAFRKKVRKAIKENDNTYMLSRFLLIRCLDPSNEYHLFNGEDWYEKCLEIAKQVVSEVFKSKDLDDDSLLSIVELYWSQNDLDVETEELLEKKFIEYINKS